MVAPLVLAGAGVAAGSSVLGSVLGAIGIAKANKDFARADRLQRELVADFQAAGLVGLDSILSQLTDIGAVEGYTPATYEAALQQQTGLSNFELSDAISASQTDALSKLQDITDGGGLTDADRGLLQSIQFEENQGEAAQRAALAQNAAARGIGGSGFEQRQAIAAQQDGANRTAQRGRDVAQLALQRLMEATQAQGTLARGLGQDEFTRAQGIASAEDAINQFNASQTNQAVQFNAGAQNQAMRDEMDARVGQRNLEVQQGQARANLSMDYERTRQERERALLGAGGANVQSLQNAGQRTANEFATYGSAVTGLGGALAAPLMTAGLNRMQPAPSLATPQALPTPNFQLQQPTLSDESSKTGISEIDGEDILEKLTGMKYRYKESFDPEGGEQVGVMADDMEDVAPQLVSKGADGMKRIDYSEAGGPLFAALAALAEQVQKLEQDRG